MACDEHALLHPDESVRTPYITQALMGVPGPVIAVSDWMRAVPDQISRWVPADWSSLGTDGFGRSDTRAALRRHFHIDAESIATQVLAELGGVATSTPSTAAKAVDRYRLRDEQVDPAKENEAGSSEISG